MAHCTDQTKKVKKSLNLTRLVSFTLTVMPIIVYFLIGLTSNEVHVGEKVFLGFSFICAIILVLINMLMKYHLRSPLFILLLGIYNALDKILPLLVIISISVIIDEFILQPRIRKLKVRLECNKTIDERFN